MMVVAEVFEEAAPAILQRLYQRGANPHAVDEVRATRIVAINAPRSRVSALFPFLTATLRLDVVHSVDGQHLCVQPLWETHM